MNSHPDIHLIGEFLYPDYFEYGFYDFWLKEIEKDRTHLFSSGVHFLIKRYLQEVLNSRTEPVILFDLKLEQLSEIPVVSDGLYTEPGLKFIQMTRLNLLKQVVSEWIMYQRAKENLAVNSSVTPEQRSYILDPNWVVLRMQRKKREADLFNSRLDQGRPSDVFKVTYEQLQDPQIRSETLTALLTFMELPPANLTSELVKQNTAPMADTVENWDEVRKRVDKSEFAYTLYLPQ